MKYPKYTEYEKMYKRYFNKGVEYLINKAELSKNDKVLDICGGNGRLTRELLKICDDVSYLDKEADMIPEDLEKHGVKVYNEDVESFVSSSNKKYNKVFCEQAINYWLLNIDIEKFSNIFLPNGLFIFNTFSNMPTKTPMIKQYTIDGINYLEISYLVNNKVEHIQIREGYPPHFTEFDWISKEQYNELLSPYFDIELFDDGKSSLYKCKRKSYE
jgi:SAM-dependent methyltransferase